MRNWHRFPSIFLGVAAGLVATMYLFVALVDPYDSLPLSLPLDRLPATSNQRFAYPALARDSAFDSAVFGTSTARLLDPRELDPLFGARFANLAMNSATAWEQRRLMELFLAAHPHTRTVILGIDDVWCMPTTKSPRLTFRPFPPWLYDDNPWNDYAHLLNGKALEDAGRALWMVLGLKAPKFDARGYENFLPDPSEYDLAHARENLYGTSEPPPPPDPADKVDIPPEEVSAWTFPDLAHLVAVLAAAPAKTLKVLFFVPYHRGTSDWPLGRQGSVREACKDAVVDITAEVPAVTILDFMRESEITDRDANYWDQQHYTVDVATRLADLIHQGAATGRSDGDLYTVLRAR